MSGFDHFCSLMHFMIKNGLTVLFWHDSSCGDHPLKFQFPDLFRMAPLKDACAKVVSYNGDQNHWNITFLRSPNDWEEEDVLSLLALLANTKVVLKGEDEIHWPHDSSAQFTIKSYCKETDKGSTQLDFPAKAIPNSKAPTNVCFLAWATTKGKIPMEDMFKRRNFKLASRRSMCLVEEVPVDHLFVHCRWSLLSGICHYR